MSKSIRSFLQKTLDNTLLPMGILSSHIRREKAEKVTVNNKELTVNNKEYVIYKIISSKYGVFDNGVAITNTYYIDINYYYEFNQSYRQTQQAEQRIKLITENLKNAGFKIVSGQRDIPDIESKTRGINIEITFMEVI